MEYLHTMVRVSDLAQSLDFYINKLGLVETRRVENESGRYTLIFLAAPGDMEHVQKSKSPLIELTYNWDKEAYDGGRNFGHLAFAVEDIYAFCDGLKKAGVTINRPPRDGSMAFVRSPDNVSIELLQKGPPQPKQEPWASMPNIGVW
ncbi:lactoylglutathione lyase [Beijerinckiaceae bacterium]|nr:lactoylglutathione lyase [Beijerinckiaceae bacterium]